MNLLNDNEVTTIPIVKHICCHQGKQFSIWTVCDLEDCDRTVKFFLFGEVHKHLWKTQYGSVIGLLNANIMPAVDKVCII